MTRLDRYIIREVIPPFVFGLLLYVGLILLSDLLGRAQWLVGFPLFGLLKWLWYQVPYVLNQTLPIAVLLSVLLAYGRLGRENELMAMRAGGIHLVRTARWLFVGAGLLVLVSLVMTEKIIPYANQQAAVVWWNQLATHGNGLSRLAGQNVAVGPYQLFFGGYDYQDGEMKDVRLESWDNQVLSVAFADRGRLDGSTLTLRGYHLYSLDYAALPLPDLSNYAALRNYLPRLIKAENVPQNVQSKLVIILPKTKNQLIAQDAGGGFEDSNTISYWFHKVETTHSDPEANTKARVMLSSLLAMSFASLVVLFMALPIAVKKVGGNGLAFGYSLIVTIGYYLVFTLGKLLALNGVVMPELGAWGANILALLIGLWIGKGVYR